MIIQVGIHSLTATRKNRRDKKLLELSFKEALQPNSASEPTDTKPKTLPTTHIAEWQNVRVEADARMSITPILLSPSTGAGDCDYFLRAWNSKAVLPDVTYVINSSATPTGALSYQPRECTRVQNDSGPSGSSSSKRSRVCNDGQRRNPSDPPNHHTPVVTTSGTPSDTSGGRLDSTGTVYFHRVHSPISLEKLTKAPFFIQNDTVKVELVFIGSKSTVLPRCCNSKHQVPPNYPTPPATTSSTPSDTATGHVDSTECIKDGFRSARVLKYYHCCHGRWVSL
ncbi:hypothetical protein Tco_0883585 [Tanacetum coccineum]